MNLANPQKQVPGAEENNWVIKKTIRAHYQQLPYKNIQEHDQSTSYGYTQENQPFSCKNINI